MILIITIYFTFFHFSSGNYIKDKFTHLKKKWVNAIDDLQLLKCSQVLNNMQVHKKVFKTNFLTKKLTLIRKFRKSNLNKNDEKILKIENSKTDWKIEIMLFNE